MKSYKFGRLFIGIEGYSLTEDEKNLIKNEYIAGIVLFSRNFKDKIQLKKLCREIKSIKENIIISVDQEGGRVQRFIEGFVKLPSLEAIGKIFKINPSNAKKIAHSAGLIMAYELVECGVDISFSPVIDLNNPVSKIIGNRSFSSNPKVVIKLAREYVRGMNDAGMQATVKHFPGHGNLVEDSHIELPVDLRSFKEIESNDLLPFRELIDNYSSLMTAHILVKNIDKNIVTFSEKWIKKILKRDIGFKGVIFTDDLSMAGSGDFSIEQKLENSFNAGCDIALICDNQKEVQKAINFCQVKKVNLLECPKVLKANFSIHKNIQKKSLENAEQKLINLS